MPYYIVNYIPSYKNATFNLIRRSGEAALRKSKAERNGTEDGRKWIGCPIATERRMGGCGSVVPWKWNGGWEVTDRLYGAVGEKSIDFQKILSRLFGKTL